VPTISKLAKVSKLFLTFSFGTISVKSASLYNVVHSSLSLGWPMMSSLSKTQANGIYSIQASSFYEITCKSMTLYFDLSIKGFESLIVKKLLVTLSTSERILFKINSIA